MAIGDFIITVTTLENKTQEKGMSREAIHGIEVAQCMAWKPIAGRVMVVEINQRGQIIRMMRLKLSQAHLSNC